MEQYEEPPVMISGKDLDYLSDIYEWNMNAYRLCDAFYKASNDEAVKDFFKRSKDNHKEHIKTVINILE